MDRPLFFADNIFDGGLPGTQYPDNTLSANAEATGHEVERLANGVRDPNDFWSPVSFNAIAWAKVQGDRVRGADMVALDAGHNMADEVLTLEGSDDDFTTIDTVASVTIPSVHTPGALLDNPTGVVTEDGAWLKRFPFRAHLYWRAYFPAMGANLKPEIVGLQVGMSYESRHMDFPFMDDANDLLATDEFTSAHGWMGGQYHRRRAGRVGLRMRTAIEYDLARFHVHGLFGNRTPTWIVFDQDQPDRAVRAVRQGRMSFEWRRDWWQKRRGEFDWVEHEPLQT